PAQPTVVGIKRQRDSGADADFEDASADPFGRGHGGVPTALEHSAEDQIVNRRPARIGFGDSKIVEIGARANVHASSLPCRDRNRARGFAVRDELPLAAALWPDFFRSPQRRPYWHGR